MMRLQIEGDQFAVLPKAGNAQKQNPASFTLTGLQKFRWQNFC
jgi:hypothetical protein